MIWSEALRNAALDIYLDPMRPRTTLDWDIHGRAREFANHPVGTTLKPFQYG